MFEQLVGEAVARPRLLTVLLGLFGTLGLVLGAVDLYGVLSYLVSRRRREIGVRIALGAPRSSVLGMVVKRGLVMAGVPKDRTRGDIRADALSARCTVRHHADGSDDLRVGRGLDADRGRAGRARSLRVARRRSIRQSRSGASEV